MLQFKLPLRLMEESNEGSEGSSDTTTEEQQTEESSAETEEETTEEQEEIDEKELKQARSLYKLLKDPNTATDTLRILATRAGILKDVETREDVKEAKKELKDIVKEKLGTEYAFLAEKMTSLFEAVLEEERSERQASFQKIEATNTEKEVQSIFDKLARETKGASRSVEGKIAELTEQYQIGKGVTVEDYLRGLYAMATASSRTATVKGQIADRIRRNASDVPARLGNATGNKEQSPIPGKKMTLNESVAFAMEQLNKKK